MNFKLLSRMKTMMTTGSFLLPICSTLSAAPARAGALRADLQLVLPKSDIVQEALRQRGALKFTRESLTFSSEFPVELHGIELDFDYQVKALVPGGDGTFSVQVEVSGVNARARDLRIDTLLEVEASGVKARIPIKASCSGVHVRGGKPLVFELKGQVREQPRLSLALTDVDWVRAAGVWRLDAESCEAAPGFTSFLNDQLAKLWVESKDLPAYVFDDLNRSLEEWFAERLTLEKNLPELFSRIALQGRTFRDAGDAWIFGIEMRVDANPDAKSLCPALKDDVDLPALGQDVNPKQAEIRVNEKLVGVWARCLHERGLLKREDRGQEIAGFRRLMSSRFLQFFVWADLMRFPKSTDFRFMTSTYGTLALEPLAGSDVGYALSTRIASRVIYPEAGRWTPYMTFHSPIHARLAMRIADSKLRVSLSGVPQTALQYRFDAPPTQLYSRGVGVSTIESEVKSFLAREVFEIALPRLELGPGIEVEAVSLHRENRTLKIELRRVP